MLAVACLLLADRIGSHSVGGMAHHSFIDSSGMETASARAGRFIEPVDAVPGEANSDQEGEKRINFRIDVPFMVVGGSQGCQDPC